VPAGLRKKLREMLGESRYRQVEMRLRRLRHPAFLGSLGRARPVSQMWGYDRGTPVDRYYIEAFLRERRGLIRGHVLEMQDSGYTDQFGTEVESRSVLDINRANPQATIIADLSSASSIGSDQFDCFILTQTLQYIFDTQSAIRHAHRLLRPGGALLVTVPAVSPLPRRSRQLTDFWRFTPASCRVLFEQVFGTDRVEVRSYGNLTSVTAFLAGLCWEELRPRQLEPCDEFLPLIVGVCAKKPL
jgi:SAM-dependent methyltransferase